jgi:signal-transduction protein with cAMP-binding, CBS, and nucleotidyltransferase domain|tara:strand:- start:132 stop:566 length:435 start_codon:yes stop_codon:yes gene_type:complete
MMKINDVRNILEKTHTFGGQSQNLLNILAFSAKKKEFSTGDLIIKSEEKISKCIVMLKGRAFIQKRETSIEIVAGDVIGNLALVNDNAIQYAIIGGSKGEVLIIDRKLFNQLAIDFPEFIIFLKDKIKSDFRKKINKLSKVDLK